MQLSSAVSQIVIALSLLSQSVSSLPQISSPQSSKKQCSNQTPNPNPNPIMPGPRPKCFTADRRSTGVDLNTCKGALDRLNAHGHTKIYRGPGTWTFADPEGHCMIELIGRDESVKEVSILTVGSVTLQIFLECDNMYGYGGVDALYHNHVIVPNWFVSVHGPPIRPPHAGELEEVEDDVCFALGQNGTESEQVINVAR